GRPRAARRKTRPTARGRSNAWHRGWSRPARQTTTKSVLTLEAVTLAVGWHGSLPPLPRASAETPPPGRTRTPTHPLSAAPLPSTAVASPFLPILPVLPSRAVRNIFSLSFLSPPLFNRSRVPSRTPL